MNHFRKSKRSTALLTKWNNLALNNQDENLLLPFILKNGLKKKIKFYLIKLMNMELEIGLKFQTYLPRKSTIQIGYR
jgi:hypothetical protein